MFAFVCVLFMARPVWAQFETASVVGTLRDPSGAAKLELRLEAFNLFNRVNFGPPNGNCSSAAFGTITGAYDARQLQLGAKVIW
jgi:hypothetical protein